MKRRRGRRLATDAGLTITSLMDMMTIILVFLLTNWGTNILPVQPSDDFQLPEAQPGAEPHVSVTVIVTRTDVFVDGERVLALGPTDEPGVDAGIPAADKDGAVVRAVYDRLVTYAAAARSEPPSPPVPGAPTPQPGAIEGSPDPTRDVLMQLDRRTAFAVVRDLMFTAGEAGFERFRFVVVDQGQ